MRNREVALSELSRLTAGWRLNIKRQHVYLGALHLTGFDHAATDMLLDSYSRLDISMSLSALSSETDSNTRRVLEVFLNFAFSEFIIHLVHAKARNELCKVKETLQLLRDDDDASIRSAVSSALETFSEFREFVESQPSGLRP